MAALASMASTTVDITGEQHTIGEIFSERFSFCVPPYQRQYAWKVENAAELLDDLRESLGRDDGSVEEAEPYFLGSIVLVRGARQEHEIVDGQQRLITLTILLSVLREALPAHMRESLTTRLYEPPDPLTNTPGHYRVRPKQADADFLRTYIQAEDGIRRLREQPHADLSEGQQNVLANARHFIAELEQMSEEARIRFAQYLIGRCLMVVIAAPGLGSAYRIFSVLNNRGVDLTDADILKADIVGPIPADEQEVYTARWERLEESLGSRNMAELLSHLRVIYAKGRPSDRLEDFRTHVLPEFPDMRRLIDEAIKPYGAAFSLVLNPEQDLPEPGLSTETRELLHWLRQLANHDWVPPALVYLVRYHDQPARLVRFLTELERLAAYFAICQQYAHRRQPRYLLVLKAIERGENLGDPDSPIQLTRQEREAFLTALDGELYLMPPTPRNYALRRLDSLLAGAAARYDQRKLTVEHVLPRNPRAGSEWMRAFPTAQVRARWVHRLGNLALLTRDKNEHASNYDFAAKKKIYFAAHGGVTPYALTTRVLREEVWTPEVVERNQRELLGRLRDLWRL